MSELIKGGVAPLFDRLASAPSEHARGAAHLETMESLQDSIGRELRRLFNTRSPLSASDYAQGSGTVLEYGIPDFSALSAQNAADLQQLAATLRQAVQRYEPRLTDVSVQVSATPNRHEVALVRIGAQARAGLALRHVDFEMLLGTPDSLMKIA
ncbi:MULTISPECIES: type VI secretion system baseplate subunit TssE [Variovorax]|uniref:type VI secretion system baseplate subunit TssE n=1 Tax=Variovorax TaxID=34072 RepID=UPI002160B537|nr:type VI secretion system baseplate subunit TssE [Variovorax paradoxus]UVH55571.1 type VI secretion system baseplate subunit TssE [Variovorax paradoxus]